MNLTEAEYIKNWWQEYAELYQKKKKKDVNEPDNRDGVFIHLEPDILECETMQPLVIHY